MKQAYRLPFVAASLSAVLLAGCRPGPRWIGGMVGESIAACYRQEIERDQNVTFALDLGRLGNSVFHVHADWTRYESFFPVDDIYFYWGLGVDLASWSDRTPTFGDADQSGYVAIRVPVGLEMDISRDEEFLLFVQIVPKVPLDEGAGVHLDAAVGIVFAF